jgi:hypothetical protein
MQAPQSLELYYCKRIILDLAFDPCGPSFIHNHRIRYATREAVVQLPYYSGRETLAQGAEKLCGELRFGQSSSSNNVISA